LEAREEVLDWLERLPGSEATLVREVVEIIIGGQMLDLERFARADRERPVALPDDAALDDYAWRVAGCVGAFWTKLGFLTLGERFSNASEAILLGRGVAYGKGLQLVNILRDVPADLAMGRCYLPVADVFDRDALLSCHARWLARASAWVDEGFTYSQTLESRRLRAATVLPAMLARETLGMLRGVGWEAMQCRIKVPRWRVYLFLLRALAGVVGSNRC
jgi:farnesyl-diphosphate farnesyltransferase